MPGTIHNQMMAGLFEALQQHVDARLRSLPHGWRVAVKMNAAQRTIGEMTASWTITGLAPGAPEPAGWTIYTRTRSGRLRHREACHTERRASAF